jgi:hypothetical protein
MSWKARKFETDPTPLIVDVRTGASVAILTASGRHRHPDRLFDEARLLAASPSLLALVDEARQFMDEGDERQAYWLARADTLLGEL